MKQHWKHVVHDALETECDIRRDRAWAGLWHCLSHSVWYRQDCPAGTSSAACPVAEFGDGVWRKVAHVPDGEVGP